MLDAAIVSIQSGLEGRADASTKTWWENYLKGAIGFRGAKMGAIRQVVQDWHREVGCEWKPTRLRELAIALLRCEQAEDKLAGILLLSEVLIPSGVVPWPTALRRWAPLFDQGFIADWNTCDWFCVKVLGPLAEQQGEACARAIAQWSGARNLWRRRAAGVAFVNRAARGDENFPGFVDMLIDVCARTVTSHERFAQTGVGWVLREVSEADAARVARFIDDHLDCMSREAVRMSTSRLDDAERKRLLVAHGAKATSRRSRR